MLNQWLSRFDLLAGTISRAMPRSARYPGFGVPTVRIAKR
jgi:hypothetical protein